MVGILKTKEIGNFTHAESLHQEGFCLVHNKVVDIPYGSPTRCLVNHITEVSGRICQLGCTVGDCGTSGDKNCLETDGTACHSFYVFLQRRYLRLCSMDFGLVGWNVTEMLIRSPCIIYETV